MRRFLRFLTIAGLAVFVVSMGAGPVMAQLGQTLNATMECPDTASIFRRVGTPATSIFNLYHRFYPDLDPTQINGPNAPVDGNPAFKRTAGVSCRYEADLAGTANYNAVQNNEHACEAWHNVWTGVATGGFGGISDQPDQTTYISYYGAQSTLVNLGESGDPLEADCVAVTNPPRTGACYGQVRAPGQSYPNTPRGASDPNGGMDPIPIPAPGNPGPGSVDLTWPALNHSNLDNRAGSLACPSGAPRTSTFDDVNTTGQVAGIDPVYGTRLYVYKAACTGGPPCSPTYRTLIDLENSAFATASRRVQILKNSGAANPNQDSRNLSCAGTGDPVVVATNDCPSVWQVPCNNAAVLGGACDGTDGSTFTTAAQSITIDRANLESIIGTLNAGEVVVFLTKVMFRGYHGGTTACSQRGGGCDVSSADNANPDLVSLFSANSPAVGFDALIAQIAIDNIGLKGNKVTLDFSAIGGFGHFTVHRSNDGGESFSLVSDVPFTGQSSYSVVDTIKGRGNKTLTYRVVAFDPSENAVQAVMQDFKLPGGGKN